MATVYQYLTPAEYADLDLSVSGITNSDLAEKHISLAERWVDAYCRGWESFYPCLVGTVDAISGSTITSSVFGQCTRQNYWAVGGLYIRVASGTAAGAERLVTASDDTLVTLSSGITGLAVGDRFVLDQHSVFPRGRDFDGERPYLPPEIKLAVAAQVSYGVAKGSEHAGLWEPAQVTNAAGKLLGESYGSGYSYQQDGRAQLDPMAQFLAPQARALLRRFRSSGGRIVRRFRRFHGNKVV